MNHTCHSWLMILLVRKLEMRPRTDGDPTELNGDISGSINQPVKLRKGEYAL